MPRIADSRDSVVLSMRRQHPIDNFIVCYGNIVVSILLILLVCAEITPVTAASKSGIWIAIVAAVMALAGYRDVWQLAGDPASYGRHALWTVLFIIGVDFITAFIEYSQQTDVSLAAMLSTMHGHLTMFGILSGVLLAAMIGYIIGGAAGVAERTLGRREERVPYSSYDELAGSVLLDVLGLAGRHPLLFLALYRTHAYYAYLWEGTPAVVNMILQILYIYVLICALLRVQQICGVQLQRADERLINAIGDVYWDHMQMVDIVFYVATACMLATVITDATMFKHIYSPNIYAVICELCVNFLLVVALLRLWDDKTWYSVFFQCGILVTGVTVWYLCGSELMLLLCVSIVAAEGVSARRIMQIFLVISLVILTIAAWASENGYILYYSVGGLHAMGIMQRTDYAAYWFYIFLIYRVLRDKRMRLIEYIVAAGVLVYVDHLAAGRTSLLCETSFLVLCFLVDYWPQSLRIRQGGRLLYKVGYLFYPICAAASYLVVAWFGPTLYGTKLDTASFFYSMRARIVLSYEGFMAYPLRLLARVMDNTGLGFRGGSLDEYYFTLDNSYVRYVINYGILFLLMIMAINIRLIYRCEREHNLILLFALAMIAIHSISEPHMAHLYHNVLLMLTFAAWDMQTTRRPEIGAQDRMQEIEETYG